VPGIAGIIGHGPSEARIEVLRSMLSTMHHEPFYVWGELFAPDRTVFVGWMTHPSSFASRVSAYRHPDGSRVIFSGECFPGSDDPDPAALRDPDLFAARLIEGCRRDGARFLRRLNGLFSGLLLDRSSRQCLLFNDRFGVERLYVHEADDVTLFASEAKALLRVKADLRVLEPGSVAEFLKFGSVSENRTLFRGVRLVPGGSAWSFQAAGAATKQAYFAPAEWESQPALSEAQYREALTATMRSVVPAYVRSEQPVGISITGGVDTRMIMACLPPDAPRPSCYTFSGPDGATLDQRIGRKVTEACGLEHRSIRIKADWLAKFGEYVDRTVWITDGCAGATLAHEIYLTARARQIAPVRLTGNFGSEVLRGVSSQEAWLPAAGFLDPGFSQVFQGANFDRESTHPVTSAAFREIPRQLFGSLAAGRSQIIFRTPYLDHAVVRLAYQAPALARLSAAASLHVVKSLNPSLAAIPTDRGIRAGDAGARYAVRRAAAEFTFKLDYLDKEGLPGRLWALDGLLSALRNTNILGLHKYLPYRTWFKYELRNVVASVTNAASPVVRQFVCGQFLETMVTAHRSGRQNLLREINAVLTLDSIGRVLTDETSVSPTLSGAGPFKA